MGIPKFFRWISERYPLCSQLIEGNRVPEFDCLYLDMNGVIHQCSHSSNETLITARDESEIFLAVFAYVQALFDKIRPRKLLFLAVDGVAPRAKMNQQRSRRFRTAAEKAEAEAKADKKAAGAVEGVEGGPKKYFDTNCITPGTEFMERLSAHLRFLIARRIDEDPAWRDVEEIVFSGPEVPGEGEHKVMEWIRAERTRPEHNPNLRHCLYGLDADLIMLGLLSHEPHFSLLREEVTFGRKGHGGKGTAATKSADSVRFYLMHLGLLREYLQAEFEGLQRALGAEYDFERVLDDFVLLSLFVGNDFLPHLPHLHINENALGLLFEAYKCTRASIGGYLNDGGRVHMQRCAAVLENVLEYEREVFESDCADELGALIAGSGKGKQKGNRANASATTTTTTTTTTNTNANPNPLSITPRQRRLFDDFVENFLKRQDVACWAVNGSLLAEHPEDRVFVAGLAKDFLLVLECADDHELILRKCSDPETSDAEDENEDEDTSSWQFTLDTTRAIARYERRPMTSELDAQALVNHEASVWRKWKSRYYAAKMDIREEAGLAELLQKYCEGLEWVMAYYYEGVASWGWFFPFHYGPFLSDVVAYLKASDRRGSEGQHGITFAGTGTYRPMQFDLGLPFKPLEQLMGVLPSLSAALVPPPLAALMTAPDSPILHFFPTEYESDLNGKKNSWEAVVKIPFIDERLLLETLHARYGLLSAGERARNEFGLAVRFKFAGSSGATMPLIAPSAAFESIDECRVTVEILPTVRPPRSALRLGLTPGVRIGPNGPVGFPSLGVLSHSGALQHLDVLVFSGQPSKSLTLALVVMPSPTIATAEADPLSFLRNVCVDHRVFVGWPFLIEAEIAALVDGERVYCPNGQCTPLTSDLISQWSGGKMRAWSEVVNDLEATCAKRQGVLLAGGVGLVAAVYPFTRLRLSPRNGAIEKEFARDQPPMLVPLHLVIVPAELQNQLQSSRPALSARERPSLAGASAKCVAETFSTDSEDANRHAVLYVGPQSGLFGRVGRVVGWALQGRALMMDFASQGLPRGLRASHCPIENGSASVRTAVARDLAEQEAAFITANELASAVKLPHWLVSKLTSTMQLTLGPGTLLNIGLGVKFEGRSLAVPRYARRPAPGRWLFSRELIAVFEEYRAAFPELFEGLAAMGQGIDRAPLEEVLRAGAGRASKDKGVSSAGRGAANEWTVKLKEWLKSRAFPATDEAIPCTGTTLLSPAAIKSLVGTLDQDILVGSLAGGVDLNGGASGKGSQPVGPINPEHCIRRSEAVLFAASVGSNSRFAAGDRIVHVGDGADGIAFGATGTVVGVIGQAPECELWIVLDAALKGIAGDLGGRLAGIAGLAHRGIVLSANRVINTTQPPVPTKQSPSHKTAKSTPHVAKGTAYSNAVAAVEKPVKTKPAMVVVKKRDGAAAGPEDNSQRATVLLDELFKAASLGAAPAKPKGPEPAKHKEPEPAKHKGPEPEQKHSSLAAKPAATAPTVKISYSTRTKSINPQK